MPINLSWIAKCTPFRLTKHCTLLHLQIRHLDNFSSMILVKFICASIMNFQNTHKLTLFFTSYIKKLKLVGLNNQHACLSLADKWHKKRCIYLCNQSDLRNRKDAFCKLIFRTPVNKSHIIALFSFLTVFTWISPNSHMS